jgi:hypothetical protein
MKFLALALVLTLSACATINPPSDARNQQVEVMGRTWTVTRNAAYPNSYSAVRDNNDLDPYGPPAKRRTPQAIRAVELASGCKVESSSLWQDTTARFYANMICP